MMVHHEATGGGRRLGAHSSASENPPSNGGVLPDGFPSTSEDLHAWSIYRQNLNSDFTDSALGSSEKSPMPYGNFQLRESTMQSILANPKYGPKSELGTNMYTYLKFGLPRVHAHGRGTEGQSSGYDSTDEDIGVRGGGASFHALRSAKSEDFLGSSTSKSRRGNFVKNARKVHPTNIANELLIRDRRLKSVSETNLLHGSASGFDSGRLYRSNGHLQSSRHDLLHKGAFVNRGMEEDEDDDEDEDDLDEDDVDMAPAMSHKSLNKAHSHMSLASRATHLQNGGVSYRQEAPILNDKYFPRESAMLMNGNGHLTSPTDYDGFKYPHLQMRNITFDTKGVKPGKVGKGFHRVLEAISMEARGGELVAVMATKVAEGTAFCDILANNYHRFQSRLSGEILVNGVTVSPARLSDRVAYVKQDNYFSPDMSVRQTMLFHAFLREAGTHSRSRDTKGRINALIEDLGLAQVKHTRVKDLTVSERQRLNVACQLLLDTDIVVLDQPTRGMDIFDTFFLVEYLRQWAARGRIVIITLQPPTYEILTMISKIVLISTGRTMYYGKRREMLPYFAFIEYPCPAYKNPSDYYLDLVTLDDLSAEAMIESSQRIDQLANAFKRRAEPLSDPGPPGILPPKIKRANFIVQIFGLWIRALIYMFPFNVISWVKLVLLAGCMSICMGGIFMGIRWRYWDSAWQSEPKFEQPNVNDRMGFHFIFMCVGVWPMLMAMITDEWSNKRAVTRDVNDRLYSKFAYILTKTIYSIPSSGLVFLAYIIPGYLLAGLHYPQVQELDVFYIYIGFMLIYLFTLRVVCLCLTYLFNSRHWAATVAGVIVTLFSLMSGYSVHYQDLASYTRWIQYVSPTYQMSHPIIQGEMNPVEILRCSSNPVYIENSIIKQTTCGLPNGKEAVKYFGFLDKFEESEIQKWVPIFITLAIFVFFQLLTFIFFIGKTQKAKMSRSRKSKL